MNSEDISWYDIYKTVVDKQNKCLNKDQIIFFNNFLAEHGEVVGRKDGVEVIQVSAEDADKLPQDIKDNLNVIEETPGLPIYEIAYLVGMFKSKGEARRMAKQGGLYLNRERVDENRRLMIDDLIDYKYLLIGVGKHKFRYVELV